MMHPLSCVGTYSRPVMDRTRYGVWAQIMVNIGGRMTPIDVEITGPIYSESLAADAHATELHESAARHAELLTFTGGA